MNNARDETVEARPMKINEKKRKRNLSPKRREKQPKGICTYQQGNTMRLGGERTEDESWKMIENPTRNFDRSKRIARKAAKLRSKSERVERG